MWDSHNKTEIAATTQPDVSRLRCWCFSSSREPKVKKKLKGLSKLGLG